MKDSIDPLTENVGRFLKAWLGARQIIQAANFNRFQKAGLSATQFITLNLIPTEADGTTLSQLAQRMNLGPATLTRTIDSLQARGLLTRMKSTTDRRQVILSLTKEGARFQNLVSSEFHRHIADRFRCMSAHQQNGLVEGLEALLAANTELESNPINPGDVFPRKRSSGRSQEQ